LAPNTGDLSTLIQGILLRSLPVTETPRAFYRIGDTGRFAASIGGFPRRRRDPTAISPSSPTIFFCHL